MLAIGAQFKKTASEVHPAIRLTGMKTQNFSDASRDAELSDSIIIDFVRQKTVGMKIMAVPNRDTLGVPHAEKTDHIQTPKKPMPVYQPILR